MAGLRTTVSVMAGAGAASSAAGPAFLLFCLFLTLKLTDVIDWSWWWVTAPLWIPPLGTLGIALFAVTAWGLWRLFSR